MNEKPWSWRINHQHENGNVDAQVISSDEKSSLYLSNVQPGLAESVTSLLESSFKWGYSENEQVSSPEKQAELHASIDEFLDGGDNDLKLLEQVEENNRLIEQIKDLTAAKAAGHTSAPGADITDVTETVEPKPEPKSIKYKAKTKVTPAKATS